MSDWSLETLREHLLWVISANDKRYEQRFEASQHALNLGFSTQKSAVDAALAAADRAVSKAELAAEKRFDGVNEFRNALSDQQRTLIPRAEAETMLKALSDKVAKNEQDIDRLTAERMGIRGGWGYAVGVVGFVVTLISVLAMFMRQGAGRP